MVIGSSTSNPMWWCWRYEGLRGCKGGGDDDAVRIVVGIDSFMVLFEARLRSWWTCSRKKMKLRLLHGCAGGRACRKNSGFRGSVGRNPERILSHMGIRSSPNPFHLDLEDPSILAVQKKIERSGKRFAAIEIGRSCNGSNGHRILCIKSPAMVLTTEGVERVQRWRRRQCF